MYKPLPVDLFMCKGGCAEADVGCETVAAITLCPPQGCNRPGAELRKEFVGAAVWMERSVTAT